jgi:type IV pilus assembly protein PilE
MDTKASGFSLLELMIALGVAGIIAMFALPAYRSHVVKANRLDAAAALMRAVQAVESARLAQIPGEISLPAGTEQAIYTLALRPESATNGGYSIEATPVAAGPMQDDACGTFIVDATGLRTNRTASLLDTAQSSACWSGKG